MLFGFGPTYANSGYSAVVRQADGSLVFAGKTESVQGGYIERAVLVQRRLADGRLDPSFHTVVEDGSFSLPRLAVQADGDVLYTTRADGGGRIRRLNPDGTLDASYGKEGSAAVPFDPLFLAVDSAGRTVVAGTAGIGGHCHDCVPTPVVAVARLLPNGTLDMSFGEGGSLITTSDGGYGSPVGLTIGAEGSIVVAGEHSLIGVTASGALDLAFGHAGAVPVDGTLGALTRTTTGDLVAAATSAGYCCSDHGAFVLHAYRPDGSPDPAWGNGGSLTIQVGDVDVPTALAPGPAGTVMLAGETAFADEAEGCRQCNFQPYVARLTASGAVDPTFAPHLTEPPDPYRSVGTTSGYTSRVGAIAVLPDGGAVLAGASDADGSSGEQATATALSASGSPEPGFGIAGVAADPESLPSNTEATAFAAGPGGSLVATYLSNGGSYTDHAGLRAWSADGKLLQGYGEHADLGYAKPPAALEADGRGRLYRIEQRQNFIRRFDSGGLPDQSYGEGGEAHLPPHFATEALVVRRSGAALAVGRIAKREPMALFRLTPTGRPDRRFGKDGLALVRWRKGAQARALAATFDRSGRIVLFGLFGLQTPLARLLPNGRLDRSFGNGGRINFKPELAVEVSAVSVAGDGRIYLATSPEGGGETTLVRFRANGVRDRSFGKGGVVRIEHAPELVRFFTAAHQLVLVSGNGHFLGTGFALYGFHLDGRPERSFGHDGVYKGGSGVTKGFGAIGAVREPSGGIVVAGTRRPRSYGESLELLRFR